MTQETLNWIEENAVIFRASQRLTPEQLDGLWAAYNELTGKTKPVTACARCVKNAIDIVKNIYIKYKKENPND